MSPKNRVRGRGKGGYKGAGDASRKRPSSADPRWSAERWPQQLSSLAQRLELDEVSARLREAMTHRSYANEQRGQHLDNQRLELLGDAILGSAVTLALWSRCPEATEGELSALRAQLINAETLTRCAEELALDEALRLGRGEPKMGERARRARLADAFEALVGARCLDLGQEEAQRWVWSRLEPHFESLSAKDSLLNIKTRLQHKAHSLGLETPRYERSEAESGLRVVSLWIGAELLATCSGPVGRRELEERAAEEALNLLITSART